MTHSSHRPSPVHGHVFLDDDFAAALETEGELAAGVSRQAVALCAELLDVGGAVERVADLGCGPGVDATLLAGAFASAQVVAVDASPVMLARAGERAARLGCSDRIELRSLDLDGDLGSLGTFDLAWAALALHHTEDERAALANFASLLRPGGLLCLLERAEPTVISPAHELGRPGLWRRLETAQAAHFERTRASLPGIADVAGYADMLEQVGLELLSRRTLSFSTVAPSSPALRALIDRYVRGVLRTLDQLDPSDREALEGREERVADSGWGDARVTSSRTLFIARTRRTRG
jgi:SAM-dependent methyltransferase